VQAGTATSTRGRGEANAFNVLRIERGKVTVEHWVCKGKSFQMGSRIQFSKTPEGWQRA
jgi:hypothetical protein